MSQVSGVSFVYCILQEQDSCTLVGGFQDQTTVVATSSIPLKVLFKKWMKPGGFDLYLGWVSEECVTAVTLTGDEV